MSDVNPGDIVKVNEEGLKTDLTPVLLMKVGWPNHFCVRDVLEDENRGTLYVLDPCCNWMVDWKKKDYPYLCSAHPEKYFEKIEGKHVDIDKGERIIAVGVGNKDFLSVASAAEGKSAKVLVNIPGLPSIAIDGSEIKEVLDKVKGSR